MRTEAARPGLGMARGGRVLLDLEMEANRSLSPRGARLLGGGVAVVLSLMALRAQMAGAWPIAAFLVADAALFLGLFVAFLRRPVPRERLVIAEGMLRIEQDRNGGVRLLWPAGWVRLEEARGDPRGPLILSHCGRRIAVGTVLSPDERAEVRSILARALDRARTAA